MVISAGFKEVGGEGVERERALVEAVAELDVDPLLAFEHGAVAVDGRVRLAAP